jgi:hypothetical protein
MAIVPCRPVRRFRGENLKKGNFMHVPGRAWRISLRDNNQYEILDEAGGARMIEGEPISLVDAVRAGDEFILAMGNCAQCRSACHLWFMSDSETPTDVCPYLIYFADFGAKARRQDAEGAIA